MEITEEIHYAQRLASNERKLSEKALKKVGKWLAIKSVKSDAFTEESLMKLWKGLFYYFWNTDKPLVQEEKADVICSYIHIFKTVDYSFLYIDTFFQTMAREWFGIDRFRLEKFMMFVRKFLHQSYQLLKNLNWELEWIKRFRNVLRKSVLDSSSQSIPLGLKLHISDIYMEELAKVGAEELTSKKVKLFLVPYCRILIESDEPIFLKCISKDIFAYLINQSADEELFEEFPVLKFDADAIQSLLMKYANKPGVKKLNMKMIYNVIKQFEDYKNGVSSLSKIFLDKRPAKRLRKRDIEKAALNLMKEESSFSQEKEQYKRRKLKLTEDIEDI